MSRPLALAALLIPLVAQAEPIRITGPTELTFTWDDASGPVVAYEAKLVYLDGTESAVIVGLPPVTFRPRHGIAFRLSVRGCREGPVCDGPWSDPSTEWRWCFIASDVDCDNVVGFHDFGVMMKAWGETADE